MSKILISNVMFYGFHGVYEYEREQGQRFYFDVEMKTTNDKAADTDQLEDAVDYVSVYQLVKDLAEHKRFSLLEALAGHIGDQILATYAVVGEVTVRVRKPSVPIAGPIDFVQVETTRSRK